jgi:hypothetical protein
MSSPIDNLETLGTAPNNSVFQGIIKNATVQGVTTSRWNVRSGGESQTVYKGTQAQVNDIAKSCQTLGYEYSIQGGHLWTITITFPVDIIINSIDNEPQPLTTWEYSQHPVKQNIFEAAERTFIGNLNYKEKIAIDYNMKKDRLTLNDMFKIVGTDPTYPYLSSLIAFNLKKSGVEGRNIFVPTLKRSVIISNTYNPNATPTTGQAWDNSANGMLLTTDALIQRYAKTGNNFQDIPPFIISQFPTGAFRSVWQNASNPNATLYVNGYSQDQNGIVTFVGWLESPPEYQTISLNKVQATQQWQFFAWSAGAYGLYTPFNLINSASEPDPSQPTGYKDKVSPFE